MIDRVRSTRARFEAWLFAPGPPAALWALRTGLALLFGTRLLIGQYRDLASQPPALFDPPSLWRLLDRMPSADVITTLQIAGVLLATLTVLGRGTRTSFACTWLIFLFLEGLIASRGKVIHNDVVPILAAVPVLLAPAQASWRDRRDRAGAGWPVHAAMTVVALAYFFTGTSKLLASGPAWVFSDNLRWVLEAGSRSSMAKAPELAAFLADQPFLPQALALGTLIVEIGMITVLTRPQWRPVALLAIAMLHTTIFLTLGLDYFSWVATAALVLLPWPQILGKADELLPNPSDKAVPTGST